MPAHNSFVLTKLWVTWNRPSNVNKIRIVCIWPYVVIFLYKTLGVPGQFDGSYSDKVHMTGRLQNKSYQTHHYHHSVDTSGREDDMDEQLIVTNQISCFTDVI